MYIFFSVCSVLPEIQWFMWLICFLCLQLYFQIEPEEGTALIKLKAVIDLFDELVEEPLFNQLRYNETVHSYMTHLWGFNKYSGCWCIKLQAMLNREWINTTLLWQVLWVVFCESDILYVAVILVSRLACNFLLVPFNPDSPSAAPVKCSSFMRLWCFSMGPFLDMLYMFHYLLYTEWYTYKFSYVMISLGYLLVRFL